MADAVAAAGTTANNVQTDAETQANAKTTSTTKKTTQTLDQWKADAKKKLLDMSTSNSDILDFITAAAQDDKSSAAKMQAINFLINVRSEIATLITNTMRTMFDTSAAIIHNIRD